MIWISIIISGVITYLIRASTLVLIQRNMISEELRVVLSYVPSAIFPAIWAGTISSTKAKTPASSRLISQRLLASISLCAARVHKHSILILEPKTSPEILLPFLWNPRPRLEHDSDRHC